MRRFGTLLGGLALLQILGGHWAALQVTAWVGMLVKYSQAEGVQVGISKTFDGKHPCDLCVSIAKTRRLKRSKARSLTRPRLTWSPSSGLDAAASGFLLALRTTIVSLLGHDQSPPVPPPRHPKGTAISVPIVRSPRAWKVFCTRTESHAYLCRRLPSQRNFLFSMNHSSASRGAVFFALSIILFVAGLCPRFLTALPEIVSFPPPSPPMTRLPPANCHCPPSAQYVYRPFVQ